MVFDYGDTSLIQKQLTYLRKTKNIWLRDGDALRKQYADVFPCVNTLMLEAQELKRYNEFWDTAFPLLVTNYASAPKLNEANKKYILTIANMLPYVTKTAHGFEMSPQLHEWVLTHPANSMTKELELDGEDPPLKFFLKRVLFEMGTKEVSSSFEREFLRELLAPATGIILGASSHLSYRLDYFQIVSYAPGSAIIHTSNDLTTVKAQLAEYNCSGFITVMEADTDGADWYLRTFK